MKDAPMVTENKYFENWSSPNIAQFGDYKIREYTICTVCQVRCGGVQLALRTRHEHVNSAKSADKVGKL